MCRGKRVYVTFPLFHCAGIHMLLPASLYAGFTVVLGPFPPSAEVVNSVHLHGNVQHSCLAPTTLVELVKDPAHLENLSQLELITFGGGPCPEAVSNLVSTKTRLLSCLGTTECGILPALLSNDPEDWPYLRLDLRLGYEYRHSSDDLYEQVIVRDQSRYPCQGIFATFPNSLSGP
jgi:acyl-CoA synthetase (AMP-forming)/AMP-acid ligase II